MLSSRNIQYGLLRPSSATASTGEDSAINPPTTVQSSRPSHFRTPSYLSSLTTPVEPRPRSVVTMPADGSSFLKDPADKAVQEAGNESSASSILPKIHLPGHRSRHSQELRNGQESNGAGGKDTHLHLLGRTRSYHRHTRSEAPRGKDPHGKYDDQKHQGDIIIDHTFLHPGAAAGKAGSGMLTKMASNLSSRNLGQQQQHKKPHHQHSASDFHKSWNVAVTDSNGRRPDVRRRATSDPRAPPSTRSTRDGMQAQYADLNYADGSGQWQKVQRPMTEVERLLQKAEEARKEAERNVTNEDVARLSIQLAESNMELHDQLAGTTRTYTSLMRRLDDAYYALMGTASSLIDTISSFQSLSHQSSTLTQNFENKARELDTEIRQTLDRHRTALLEGRGAKIIALEERGKRANDRAEEMSRRLENCRTMVRNYTERQKTKRRAWKGVLVGSLWGFGVIVLGIVLGFGLWWIKNYGGDVQYGIHEATEVTLDSKGLGSIREPLHDLVNDPSREQGHDGRMDVLSNVPEDVQVLLEDIARRHNGSESEESSEQLEPQVTPSSKCTLEEDGQLQKLFEKLEL